MTKSLGPRFTALQLNIEGISKDKSEFLSKLCHEKSVDIILLQETHTATDEQLVNRGTIPGYTLVDSLNSAVHGNATYIKNAITNFKRICKTVFEDVSIIVTKVNELTISNIYKPPNATWPINFPFCHAHPSLYIGDFNCHHTSWGYEENNTNGTLLSNWIEAHDLYLHHDAKDRKSFHSARWKRDYNPDLCISSTDHNSVPLNTVRKVLNDFPRSQHRPVLITTGIEILSTSSLNKPRWNFQKANWLEYSKLVNRHLRWIPPNPENFKRFVGVIKSAARKTIPRGFRKDYIPCWSTENERCYRDYQLNPTTDKADRILSSLNKNRKEKWDQQMSKMNFTHSSRSSWRLLGKLGATNQPVQRCESNISPNAVAARLVSVSSSVKLSEVEIAEMKRKLRRQRKMPVMENHLSKPFSIDELTTAINLIKKGKAAGFDGIFPELIKGLGTSSLSWLLSFYNNILISGVIPKEFKRAKIIAILKPGKPADNPTSYRPIALLSVCYKLFERLLYNRIQPLIEDHLPKEQGGFREKRSCCDQVLALTTHIEVGFQNRQKTGVAFLDLSAAYDTVWKDGLVHKLHKVIPNKKVVNLIENMLSDRKFRVFIGERNSKTRVLNNGLPQGSVLSPLLFNLYTSDLPATRARKFMYADDLALAVQHNEFEEIERTLAADLSTMDSYFKKWRLCLNPLKTEVSCFHLNNHQKSRVLHVNLNGNLLKHNFQPVYLGVTLDTSLTFRNHLDKTKQKLKTRNNVLNKLAGTNWGANASTLRTTALALVYSTAEYCCAVWKNSCHISKVDTQLNAAMRTVSGTISSTPIAWLPVLSNIAPPELRRQHAIKKLWDKYQTMPDKFCISQDLINLPVTRLKSRKPIWLETYLLEPFVVARKWKLQWQKEYDSLFNSHLIANPEEQVPGFNLSRKIWVKLNRLRTLHGRCNDMLYKWSAVADPSCTCGHPTETIKHMVIDCPNTKFQGGFEALHKAGPEAVLWISNIKDL